MEISIPVTRRALIQRINRRLARTGQKFRAMRSDWCRVGAFPYYVIDFSKGTAEGVEDLAEFGLKLGALKEWETVEPDRLQAYLADIETT